MILTNLATNGMVVNMYIIVRRDIYIDVYIYISTYIDIHVIHIHLHEIRYVHLCLCIFIYIYIYVHMYMYIYLPSEEIFVSRASKIGHKKRKSVAPPVMLGSGQAPFTPALRGQRGEQGANQDEHCGVVCCNQETWGFTVSWKIEVQATRLCLLGGWYYETLAFFDSSTVMR